MRLTGNVMMRIVATFVASALGVIGAGSLAGSLTGENIPVWLSAVMGGLLAVAKVVERLAIAFLEDGKLSRDEINAAFAQVVTLKKTQDSEAAEATPATPKK
jgi:hypothetical protein